MYEKQMTDLISKNIKDELTAVLIYVKMANSFAGTNAQSDVSGHLLEHADDEYGHFKSLVEYAYNHSVGDDVVIDIDLEAVKSAPTDMAGAIAKAQELETGAIASYKAMAKLAFENEDYETHEFAVDIMNDEMGHFDDFALYDGNTRGFLTGVAAKPIK